jgi:acetate kinase
VNILTLNTGSSSVRMVAFGPGAGGTLTRQASGHYVLDRDRPDAMLRRFLDEHALGGMDVAAHRVVHGGARLQGPCVIDAAVEAEIERLIPLAPLHNPPALAWIRAARAVLGAGVPQVAVFDTAFYAALPEAARAYAIPRALAAKHGLRRYGFHGLAHEAMWRRWRELRPEVPDGGRVISLQLGAGCSMTTIRDGRPLDTSMGFSPTEGLMMATRSGDVDPGLITYLQQHEGLTSAATEALLNRESGLLGVAGEADMRALLAREDADAKLALEMYCRRARKYLGAYLALLGGADAILRCRGKCRHRARRHPRRHGVGRHRARRAAQCRGHGNRGPHHGSQQSYPGMGHPGGRGRDAGAGGRRRDRRRSGALRTFWFMSFCRKVAKTQSFFGFY